MDWQVVLKDYLDTYIFYLHDIITLMGENGTPKTATNGCSFTKD